MTNVLHVVSRRCIILYSSLAKGNFDRRPPQRVVVVVVVLVFIFDLTTYSVWYQQILESSAASFSPSPSLQIQCATYYC